MALAVAHKGDDYHTYTSARTIPSFTPAANALLILPVQRNRAGSTLTSITGHGTWTLIETIDNNGAHHAVYALLTGSSPSASSIVVTYNNATKMQISCEEVTGGDVSSLANAILQSKIEHHYDGSGGPHTNSTTFDSAFGDAANFTFQSVGTKIDNVLTKDSGFTSLHDDSLALITAYLAGNDSTVEFTNAQNFNHTYHCVLELAIASVGGVIYERTLSSSVDANDPQTRYILAQRKIISDLLVSDTLGVASILSRLLSSSTTVIDTTIISSLLVRALESGINISDIVSTVSNLARGLLDNIDIADSISSIILADNLLSRVLSDNIDIQDTLAVEAWLVRTLGDNVDVSDLLIRSVSTGAIIYARILQSGINISDSTLVQKYITRGLIDTIILIDTISRDALLCRILSDNIDIIDSISKETALIILRTLSDIIDINDLLTAEIAVLVMGIIIARLEKEPIVMGKTSEPIISGIEGYNK